MSTNLHLDTEREFSINNWGKLNITLFKEVIAYFGNQSKLALAFGVHRSAISQFIKNKHLPAERALEIEALSDGKFLAVDLMSMSYERTI